MKMSHLPARAFRSGESTTRSLVLWRIHLFMQSVSRNLIRRRSLELLLHLLAKWVSNDYEDTTYLFRNLEPIVHGKVISIVAGTGIHHTLLDRSARRTGIGEDDCIRVRIIVIGVPGHRRGNMRLD